MRQRDLTAVKDRDGAEGGYSLLRVFALSSVETGWGGGVS